MQVDSGLDMSEAGRLVPRKALEGRLDSFILERMDPAQDEFVVREVMPELTWNRLDLAIKLFYLEQATDGSSRFAEELYDAHIHAFSLGNFRERGNAAKVDASTFKSAFAEIVESLRTKGFDPERSLIPVASDGSFINGGHRTACAIYLGRKVHVVETGLRPVRYDHEYFRRRGMDEDLLEAAVVKYLERSPSARVLLAPPGHSADDTIEDMLGPLVYKKKLAMSPSGSENLLSVLGTHQGLLRSAPSEPSSAMGGPLGLRRGQVRLLAYVYDAKQPAPQAKLQEAAASGLVHLSASQEESLDLARLVLNKRSLSFLNTAEPSRFPSTARLASSFREMLDQRGLPPEMSVLGPDMLLAAFGVRETSQVDVLSPLPLGGEDGSVRIMSWPSGEEVRDILQDPRRHFHYWGLKFLSVAQAMQLSREVSSAESTVDLRLLATLLPRAEPQQRARKLVYKARLVSSRLRDSAISVIRTLGLRDQAHWVRRVLLRHNR